MDVKRVRFWWRMIVWWVMEKWLGAWWIREFVFIGCYGFDFSENQLGKFCVVTAFGIEIEAKVIYGFLKFWMISCVQLIGLS